MKKLVVFDFDGTLSYPDTNVAFWTFAMRRSVRAWLFLPLTVLGACMTKLFRNTVFWREVSRLYISKKLLARLRTDFIKYHKLNRFGWAAEQVAAERAAGYTVICVSAGVDYFIKDVVKDMGFDMVICSEMNKSKPWEYKFLCFGKNKITAINKTLGGKYHIIRSYSDSRSDMPVMRLADEEVWINPRTGLRE